MPAKYFQRLDKYYFSMCLYLAETAESHMIISARSSKFLAAQFIIIKKTMMSSEIRELTYQEMSLSAASDNNEFGEITGQAR